MATLQDFREIFQDQVHDWAGDDRLEEMCATVDTIELLAKQEERERIIALIDQSKTFYLGDKFGVYNQTKIRETFQPKH